MKIAVVGLGLIGGSFCKAIKKYTDHQVLGCDVNPSAIAQALKQGAIDEAIDADGVARADMTLVCLYPRETVAFMATAPFRRGTIAVDICGVKAYVVDRLDQPLFERGVRYVPSHPMAGREFSGFAYSTADLYQHASYIVTPTERTDRDALHTVTVLARQLGFDNIAVSTPKAHDQSIAFTSQLAHVVSSAYIKSPTLFHEQGFSAGSFQDLTRVAKLNEGMWSDLFLFNQEPLLYEIDTIMEHLTQYRDALAAGDKAALQSLLKEGRVLKELSLMGENRED